MEFLEQPRPMIIAHRGASAYAPENSMAAFELALRQGADAIELDAKLSADDQVVVIHDQSVDRTTGHSGRVKDLSLAELREMDVGSHFDASFKGETIPTLEEVFGTFGQSTLINVELTNYASPGDILPQRVAALVKRFELGQRVLFSSYNPLALWRIRRLVPEAPIGLLAPPGWGGSWTRAWPGRLLDYHSLNAERSDVTPALVRNAHRRGKKVFVYTVNQDKEMRQLFKMDVDGIFTDDPALAVQIMDQNGCA